MARKRRVYSISEELIKKSQESALAAIQTFNSPLITFKAESFIVLMNIAWTYLLHSYYRKEGIEFRYYTQGKQRKKFDKTKYGADKHWELERCLNDKSCPLAHGIKDNLKFLIGIRHEIEHQMTNKIDDFISAKFQACCINYNRTLKDLFGKDYGIDKTIPLALQLFSFSEEQIDEMKDKAELPKNIIDFIADFEGELDTKNDPYYTYRVIYIRTNVNHKNQADRIYNLIDENSAEGKEIQNVLMKEREKEKYLPSQIVEKMKKAGFENFRMHEHTMLWKKYNAKNPKKQYGTKVVNTWYWHESWIDFVLKELKGNEAKNDTK